ncbi:alpha/beta fold hydrolase [Litchfieldia salsa]|uniref:Pimeloyl-ACP methyl ester carboxylesterase n=1 Tax=Litchfieldia salsa TaxID=930152 RepID=A0A1H0W4J9_9BACI|nr:alpha/beta hydrolase [Litchfieldia salsa]SDP85667.1 Pimeloyl-ACP methyl ester carboxylesterase [Litchfieldia salsa]
MGHATIYKSDEGKKRILQHYDQYINSFAFEVERTYVNTSYGKTHVLVAGPKDGKPVFILQGGNCINPMTLSWFSSVAENYRVYAPDTIGHPGYSDENRISAKDHSFAGWIEQLMNHFEINSCAFIGPSYGAGIVLRVATFMPDKIDCAILVSPAGICLGSKLKMINDILVPLVLFNLTSSEKSLNRIAGNMSVNSMKEIDKAIIGDVFKHVSLEQDMPKLTEKQELTNYKSPTLVIAGQDDVFFPASKINKKAKDIISNLTGLKIYDMGHFPSEGDLVLMNNEIQTFLKEHY